MRYRPGRQQREPPVAVGESADARAHQSIAPGEEEAEAIHAQHQALLSEVEQRHIDANRARATRQAQQGRIGALEVRADIDFEAHKAVRQELFATRPRVIQLNRASPNSGVKLRRVRRDRGASFRAT